MLEGYVVVAWNLLYCRVGATGRFMAWGGF